MLLKSVLVVIVIATVESDRTPHWDKHCKSIDSFCEVGPFADGKCCYPNVCNAKKRYGKCATCTSDGNLCSQDDECCENNCNKSIGRCVNPKDCGDKSTLCEVHETATRFCCGPYVCNAEQRYGWCTRCVNDGNLCSKDDQCCSKYCDKLLDRCAKER
ncbi:hypothetical protein Ciccas_010125 [Cichlidogyrus casuarinus]|uniref:Uncharacterized protein n=1 Tax=Cichlidogyrus casuarinus TaxID=1844966 RepID=A0ABD2PV06_9PLAT